MSKNTYNHDQIIQVYKECHSQEKTAEIIGCGHTTVYRVLKKAGIPCDGYKYKGNGGGGSEEKITDAELIEACKTMTRPEIAKAYNMHVASLDRRMNRLGVHAKEQTFARICDVCGEAFETNHAGRKRCVACNHIDVKGQKRRARKRAVAFEDGITLPKLVKRDKEICQICGKRIDWDSKEWNGHMGAMYPTIDHKIALANGGSHTWDNVQLAHAICNSKKGAKYA